MSKIQWTDITWNPATGCEKISPGCQNCYAEKQAKRLKRMGQKKYRDEFKVTCHPEELERVFPKKSRKIFVCSMGDLFHKDVPFSFIGKVFKVIKQNPQHTFQILTKRPEIMHEFLGTCEPNFIPKNVWLGITAENWDEFVVRSWYLYDIPKAVKFISMEPLLEDIYLRKTKDYKYYISHFDWIIAGGETGPNARPMNPDWARNIRDQCIVDDIPFFFKQMSKKQPIPDDLNIKEFP